MWKKTESVEHDDFPCRTHLGPLEAKVLAILWKSGECSVRQVMSELGRHYAYTTVMTTLVRLFEKNLLQRRPSERAFLYSPRISAQQFKVISARHAVRRFLASPHTSRPILLSCLMETISSDPELLEQVDTTIHEKRFALSARESSHGRGNGASFLRDGKLH